MSNISFPATAAGPGAAFSGTAAQDVPDVVAVMAALTCLNSKLDSEHMMGRLAAQTARLRRSELAAFIRAIDTSRQVLTGALEHITGIDEWTRYGEDTLAEVLDCLYQVGTALQALIGELDPTQ